MCKYLIMTTTTDTNTGNVTREYGAATFATAHDAHIDATARGLRNYRVFADVGTVDGIEQTARLVTRTACKTLLEKTDGGNVNTLHLLNRIQAATFAATIADYDAQECISAATLAIWECLTVGQYRASTDRKARAYVMENGGDLFTVSRAAIAAVLRHMRGERGYFNGRREKLLHLDGLTDADCAYFNAIVDDVAQALFMDETGIEVGPIAPNMPTLTDCVNERLTDMQRRIMLLLSEGMTQKQVAHVLSKSQSIVSTHVRLARATLAAYMVEKGMELPDGVTGEDIAALIASADKYNARKHK